MSMPPERRLRLVLLTVLLALVPATASAQVRVVLRTTKVVAAPRITAMDEDGIRLQGVKEPIGWGEVESGAVGADQAKFDAFRKALGDHLYRLRLRLAGGDYRDLLPHAEALYPRFAGRPSPTGYLVCQALMWSRLAHGRREAALEPYLRCLAILRAGVKPDLPGDRRLNYEPSTGLTPELTPVWFDPETARAALPGVEKAVAALAPKVPPGVAVLAASLALAAGAAHVADTYLKPIASPTRPVFELIGILAAQREILADQPGPAVRALADRIDRLSDANRPLGRYWLGRAWTASDDPAARRRGVLQLLYLPAAHAREDPELAGAGLYLAGRTLDDLHDAVAAGILRGELRRHFPQTVHASRLEADLAAARGPGEGAGGEARE